MPVSTRSKRKRWPPLSGDDETITLPESIYWDFIRPFTPAEDRAVLNKRSGSTQFYAGDRAEIDSAFLAKHGGDLRVTGITPWEVGGIPLGIGGPGSRGFRMIFGFIKYDEADPGAALESLRGARCAWDQHLSRIPDPSKRLRACLDLFLNSRHPNFPVKLPLLFVGDGTIQDVLRFHMAMNARSIDGTITPHEWYSDLPVTLLRYWVEKFLIIATYRVTCSSRTDQAQEIVRGLLAAGADVAPCFKELDSDWFPRDSDWIPHITPYGEPGMTRYGEPGMNLVECMIRREEIYERVAMEDEVGAHDKLRWMIDQLQAKKR